MSVEVKGRGDKFHVYYTNEERLATPFPVYDKEGNYKETLWCGSTTEGMTEAHFTGSQSEAEAYARYLVPGCDLKVTVTSSPSERLQKARAARKKN